MRGKRKPGRKKSSSISRLPPEKRARIDEIASDFGLKPEKPTSSLDRQFNERRTDDEPPPTLYQRLAGTFGVATLDAVEGVVFVILAGLLITFLGSGIAISVEAFFKATGKPVPDNLDDLAVAAEKWFTPSVGVFLVLSSIYGFYKQSQLNSGAAQYDEKRR